MNEYTQQFNIHHTQYNKNYKMSTDCYRICILPTFYFNLYFIILRENNRKQNNLIFKKYITLFSFEHFI